MTYEQITQNLHEHFALLGQQMPRRIPLQDLPDDVAREFDLAKPESRGAMRNLERIHFERGNRFYVVDLGPIVEATVGSLIFWRSGMQAGFPRSEKSYSFDMVGMVGSTNPDTGAVRITLTPYSLSPGNLGYVYMPDESLARLELANPDTDIVYAMAVPLKLFESFFGSGRHG